MRVGNKIKKIRELRNYTQEYMAYELNITQAAYHKIESNKSNISLSRLDEISKTLNVSITSILNFNEDISENIFQESDNYQEEKYQEVLNNIFALLEDQKNKIDQLIEEKNSIINLKKN